jgi:peptidoglycan hydrolase-like protein with peptidoglycan-binding domain
MSKSTRKIVAGLLSVAMVLTLVVGLSATASAQTVTFSRNLTVGSTGADVTALQTFLATKGYFTVTPTGYFGSITKRAVAQYQAANGITPAAGYFGPITRAHVAGNGGTTGGVSTVPGCPAGAIYNYLTGALCTSTGGSTSGSNTEGSLTVTQSGAPSNNTNITSNSDVQVYGLQLKAQLADVTVNRVDLDVSVYTSGPSYENPGNFVNAIKIWDGSTLVKSWSVGTADFTQGTTSNSYYVRLSNIGYVVPKDATKTLVVSFSTNGGIDNDRNVVVRGYGSNSLLATSGNNINSYYDISTLSRTHVFKKPGTATLTVAASASPVDSMTVRLASTTNGAPNASLMTFTAKSETGDSKLTSVSVIATSSNTTGATALYLMDGSTVVGQQTVSSWTANTAQTITFSNLSYVVPKDTTKTLTVTGDFAATTLNGTIASTTVSSVTYQKPNGTSATLALAIAGNNQYFYQVSPQWSLVSAVLSGVNNTTGSTTSMTATFTLKAKPVGGTMTLPVPSDFVATVASSTGAGVSLGDADGVAVTGNPSALAEGGEYTVTVTYIVNSSDLTGASSGNTLETVSLTQAKATVNGTPIVQTWGLSTFKTNSYTFNK